ncbi:MAG: DnaD domain protein [Erysipelothrix sp.]
MKRYNVNVAFKLAPDEYESLALLYQPLFAFPAMSLYLSLYQFGIREGGIDVRDLSTYLQFDTEELQLVRKELEKFALIRTFDIDTNNYNIVLNRPLIPSEFLLHPTFGRLYAIVMGHDSFIEKSMFYQSSLLIDQGKEISSSFDITRLSSWDESQEAEFSDVGQKTESASEYSFDVQGFYKSLSPSVFPMRLRTQVVTQCIGEFGSLYKMNHADMKACLMSATNFSSNTFDEKKFQRIIERNYGRVSVETVSNPYELDPMSFLAYKQNHDYIVDADRNLLHSLSQNFGFDNQVINVLIEYILETNNKNLNRSYVEKIASVWKRNNVDSLDKALKEIAKPLQKSKSTTTKSRVKIEIAPPQYSTNDQIEGDVSELKQNLKDLINKGGS